tara:strand:- start:1428 stop:1685 length:258 start_codon:yes stop_codon:yes gene_type:complete
MSAFEAITDVRGMLVKLGLGHPISRAFVAGVGAAGAAFVVKYPGESFRDDGSIKPLKWLSPSPDATNTHFLLVPAVAAGAVYLFT